MGPLLGAAWAVLTLLILLRSRPRRTRPPSVRARQLRAPIAAGDRRRRAVNLGQVLERVGGAVLRAARRPASGRPPEPLLARRVGAAVAVGAATAALVPLAVPPAVLVTWAWPGVGARRRAERRRREVLDALPDVVDLLVLAAEAGCTVFLAVAAVAKRGDGPLAGELRRVVDQVGSGRRLADALEEVPLRVDEVVRPLVSALVATERYGAPLVPGLERLADEVRTARRRRSEEAARRVPVKLLFPLVLCVLPAFALLTVAPLLASALRSLRL